MTTTHHRSGDVSGTRIGIIGLGYVGLTSACCFASLGHAVIGVDIDTERVAALNAGSCPIFEPGLDALLRSGLQAGLLSFSCDTDKVDDVDALLLCVPTPEGPTGSPDTGILRGAFGVYAPLLPDRTVVVTKSTVPLGTSAAMPGWIERDDLRFVSNPEFLREGSAVRDFLRPDRVVIGTHDSGAADLVESIYASIDTVVIRCDPLSAELIKYASNAFLATKLSFTNELARICDELDGDIDAVAKGLGSDHRIAPTYLSPGPGWGGSCFPKDVAGLATLARTSRLRVPVIESAGDSNRDHLDHVVKRILEMIDPNGDPLVAIWGLAFKANTDDVRSSPAIELIARLRSHQVRVRAHDPVATTDSTTIEQGSLLDVCDQADLLVVATEWPAFATANMTDVATRMRSSVVFDLRNVVDAERTAAAGLTLHRIGRPTLRP